MSEREPIAVPDNAQGNAAELPALIVPILRRFNVLAASLFGSAARGDARPDSDVDLLVEYARGTTLFDVAELKLELEEALGRKVDLASAAALKPRIREQVLREQVRLL